MALWNNRVQRAAPAAPENLNVLGRIATGREGPEDIFHVRGIYVLIDNDGKASKVGGGMALGSDYSCLTRMTWVACFLLLGTGVVNPLDRDITAEETKLKYEGMADIEARGDLILDAIADKEGITITDEEVNGAIEEIAGLRNETPEDVKGRLSKEGTLLVLKDGLKREKVFDLVLDKKR